MPRKSVAELAVVRLDQRQRPEPPDHLCEDAANEWRRVVGTREPDYFRAEQLAHLAAYCQHLAMAQLITREIEQLPRPVLGAHRSKLMKDRRDEMKLALDLARSLRLTLHSQRTAQVSGTASRAASTSGNGRKLWEVA